MTAQHPADSRIIERAQIGRLARSLMFHLRQCGPAGFGDRIFVDSSLYPGNVSGPRQSAANRQTLGRIAAAITEIG